MIDGKYSLAHRVLPKPFKKRSERIYEKYIANDQNIFGSIYSV